MHLPPEVNSTFSLASAPFSGELKLRCRWAKRLQRILREKVSQEEGDVGGFVQRVVERISGKAGWVVTIAERL